MTAASDKLASLDGLRAVSIVLVVMEHLHRTNGFPQGGFDNFAGDYGRLGVTIFFVISGFLITTLLLREEDKAGRVSLWRFYARRALRIIPAFLMFMFAIVAAERLGWVQLNPGDLTASFTYTVNYKPDRSWDIGHLWSLSVEEQFYLLWPFTLVMLGRR